MNDLIQTIVDNPGCYVSLDNDCFWIYTAQPDFSDLEGDDYWLAWDDWRDNDLLYKGGSPNNLLFALAEMAGIDVEYV